MITDKQARIGVKKIDRLLFLKKNLDVFQKTFDKDPNEGEQHRMKRKEYQKTNNLSVKNSKKSKKKENDGIID